MTRRPPLPPPRKRWPVTLSAGLLCILASLSLHGLLLKLPLAVLHPSSETENPVEPETVTETVAVTLLPPAPKVEVIDPLPAALETPSPQTAPPPSPAPRPTSPAPVQPELPLPVEAVTELPSDPPPPSPADTPPDPYAGFPHLAGATAGCQDLSNCWRSEADSWRAAARTLQAQLESQGYELDDKTEEILGEDTGVRIYAVTRDGSPAYYLNLVSVTGGILYTMTPEPMTADAIASIATTERF
ncbi:MAG: hypothetical protein ICV77_05075 [Cyanobacteria bacterium Co-bin8]|nr:hypothetical protein [Cyanobacteria bacterium Co-bin8]